MHASRTPSPSSIRKCLLQSASRLIVGLIVLLLGQQIAQAAYVQRYSTVTNGAVTFTGNSLGLDKAGGANGPGTAGGIGTFATLNTALVDGTFPAGTTSDWTKNGSSANLVIPAGSTVLYAELIWSGSYSYGGEDVSASLNVPVGFQTPAGSNVVTPSAATAQKVGTGSGGTCSAGPCFYVRSADVTNIVKGAGAGLYSTLGVPATQGNSENNANVAGWTLAVVYQNGSLPSRNLNLFVGSEIGGSAAATVSGFCTPPTGPRSGRLLVSAIEGDSGIAGDQMQFGPTAASLTALSGPRNPVGNFFAGQINNDLGNLDTTGTFGTRNHTAGAPSSGARQGYDITNVDISTLLTNNQTSAAARGTTTGDQFLINALGLQINVGAPIFPVSTKTVDKAIAKVGDILTYTVGLDNSTGTADANNVVFRDPLPAGLSYVAGSLTIDGAANAGNIATGVNLGTVAAGTKKIASFKARVDNIPNAPALAQYANSAVWDYQFVSCAGQPTTFGTVTTNPVTTRVARLAISKIANPSGSVAPNDVVTYTITASNDGTAASSGTTLQDLVPSNMTYETSSSTLNGAAISDVAGAMPYVSAQSINNSGQASGVLATGQSAVVTFKARVNTNASGSISNTAVGDIDGSVGGAASISATASNPIGLVADLSVVKSGPSNLTPGASVVYSIVVSNAGPSAANGSSISDVFPSDITLNSATCTATTGGALCPAAIGTASNTLSAVIATLPAGSSVTFSASGLVAAGATGVKTNTATVSNPSGVTDPTTGNNTSSVASTVNPIADLVVTKTGPSASNAGTAISYRVAIRNDGPSAANNATFSDPVPSGVSSISASCSTPTGGAICPVSLTVSGNTVSGAIPTMPAGGAVVITINGTISPSATGSLSNTASASPPSGTTDPNTGNSSSTVATSLDRVADVSIVKAGPSVFTPGSAISYSVVIRNAGPSAADGTSFSDSVPTAISGISASCGSATGGAVCPASVSVAGNTVSGAIAIMPAGSSVTITINGTVVAAATGAVTNTAAVTLPTGITDPDPTNNGSTTSGTVNAAADLSVVKTGPSSINAGGTMVYTLVFRNSGPSDVFNVSIGDNSPADLGTVTASCTSTTGGANCPTSFAITGSNMAATIPVFPAGSTITIQISGTVSGSAIGTISNTATITNPAGVPDATPGNNSSSVSTTIAAVANLKVVKTGPAAVSAGTGIIYNVVVTNQGPSAASGASFLDNVPASITGVTASCGAATNGAVCPSAVTVAGNNVSASIPIFPAGASVTFTIAGSTIASATGSISNTASVTNTVGVSDPDSTDNTSTANTPINAVADLKIVKIAPTSVSAGGTLTFQLVISNLGPSNASNSSYSDIVSSALSGLSASCGSATGGAVCAAPSVSGNSVSGNVPTLPAGGQVVINVTGTVSGSATGVITNSASVTPAGGVTDPDSSNNTSNTSTSVQPVANLKVVKTGPSSVNAGGAISYIVRVSNAGPSRADGAVFADNLPVSLQGVTASCSNATGGAICPASVSVVGNAVSAVIAALPVGGSVDFLVNATVVTGASGSITNTASVAPPTGTTDPDVSDNSGTTNASVNLVADVSILKSGPSSFTPGAAISYQLLIRNAGPSQANGTSFNDVVPASITGITASCASALAGAVCPASVSVSSNVVSGLIATLPSGGSLVITINGTVAANATGTIANTATVTPPNTVIDPDTTNNTSTANTPVVPTADLSVLKTAPTSATPGNAISYQLTIRNAGPSSANGTTFSDAVPTSIAAITASCANALGAAVCPASVSVVGNLVSGTIPTLPNGGSVVITINGTVSASASGSIANSATVTAPAGTTDPATGNNVSNATTALTPTADLTVTKVKLSPTGNLIPGQAAQYRIELNNAGPSNVLGATLTDPLPAGLSSMTWTCSVVGTADCDSVGSGTGASGSGSMSLNNIQLNAGATNKIIIIVDAVVANDATSNVTNTATATTPVGTNDPNPANNTATAGGEVTLTADVNVTKSGPPSVNAGAQISYTIIVSNVGPSAADGTVFTDNVPIGIVGASASCSNATNGAVCPTSVAVAGNTVTGVIPNLPATGIVQFTVTGTISGTAPNTILNTASVTLPANIVDPTPSNNSSASTTVVPVADLTIQKTGPSAVLANSSISYSILIRNLGPSPVANSLFTDNVPAAIGALVVSCANETNGAVCPSSISTATNNLSALIPSLPPGSSLVITVAGVVSPSATGVIANTATIAAPSGTIDPDTSNNSSTESTSVTPNANIGILKTGSAAADAGGPVSYQLLITNAGPSAADDTAFSDVVPPQVTGVTASCGSALAGAVCPSVVNVVGNSVSGSVPGLPSGGSVVITINGTIVGSASGSIRNTANVTPAAGVLDSTSGNNSSFADTTINLVADVRVVKTAPAAVRPLQTLSYNIVVSNTGPSAANGTNFSDSVSASLTGVTVTCSSATNGAVCPTGLTVIANAINTTVPTLPSGASVTFTVSGQVVAGATGIISNTATIVPPVGVTDPKPDNNSSTVTTGVDAVADLTIVKTAPSSVQAGGAISYSIVIANAGPSDAGGTSFSDAVPAVIGNITTSCVSTAGTAALSVATCPSVIAVVGNSVSGTIPSLPAGSTVTVTINGTVSGSATGTISNTATLTPPPNVTDTTPINTSTTTSSVVPVANLSILKTGPAAVNAGAGISYQLRIRNSGPSAANGASFSDAVPSSISGVVASCTLASNGAACPTSILVSGNTVSGVVPTLPNSSELVITIVGTVAGSAVGNILNTASITPPTGTIDPDSTNNTSTATTPVNPVADVQITKIAPASVNAGSVISYLVRIVNNGPSAANDTVFTDNVPASIASISANCSSATGGAVCPSTVGVSGNSVSASIPTLPAGGVVFFTISGTVLGNAPASVSNTANVTVATGIIDPDPTNNTSTVATAVQPVADLRVTKTGPASANAGAPVTYTIVAINSGPSAANNAIITDNVPTSIGGVTATCIGTTGGAVCPTVNVSGNSVSATVATFPAGATLSFTVQGTVQGGAAGSITNSVSIATPSGVLDPDLTNNTALSNSPVQPVADVRITKTATPVVKAGGSIAWQLQITNDGPSSANLTSFSDSLPSSVSGISANCSGAAGGAVCPTTVAVSGNTVSGSIATLPAGGSLVINIDGTVVGSTLGSINNSASVTVAPGVIDPSAANNTATSLSSVTPVADVSVTKTGPASALVLGVASYTVVVSNAGPSIADGTGFFDNLPSDLTLVSAVCASVTGGAVCPATVNVTGNSVSAIVATLPAGASVRFIVNATVNGTAVGNIVNTATATVPIGTIDPNASNDSGSATTPVTPVADLKIEKTALPKLNAADPITYAIKVINLGPSRANDSLLSDNVPVDVGNITATCAAENLGAVCPTTIGIAGNAVTAIIPSMPAGSSLVFTLKGTLTSIASGAVVNTATITPAAGVTDPDASNNTSSATTLVTPLADVSVTKRRTENVANLNPGATVIYDIVVRNAGPAPANGLAVADNLPASLINATWTCVVSGTADCDTTTAGSQASGTGSFNLTSVSINGGAANFVTIRVTAVVAANAQFSISNTAVLTTPSTIVDPNPDNNTATDTVAVSTSVRGRVWSDLNADAQTNGSEGPIEGLTVTLTPVGGGTPIVVVTDAQGNYVAPVVPGVRYNLVVTAPAGQTATTRNNPQQVLAGAPGEQVNAAPVGFAVAASLSGSVWRDFDHDRNRGSSEPAVGGFRVEVLALNGTVVASAITDSSGNYTVSGLVPTNPNDPTTFYTVRFIDPSNNVLYAKPVSRDPVNRNGVTDRGVIESLQLLPGINTSNQSLPLDPSGVVYNSSTRQPVAGAVVTLTGPIGFDPARHLLGGLALLNQTTGPNGYYEFWLLPGAPSGSYGLEVVAPTGLVSPSMQIPVDPSEANVPTTGGVFAVQPQADAPNASQDTRYYKRFQLAIGADQVVNNHIPLDPTTPGELFVAKAADKATIELGDALRYTVTVRHVAGPAANNVRVVDTLPAGFKYIPGTARLQTAPDAVAASIADPTGGVGPSLTFQINRVAIGQVMLLTYRVRVGVGSMQGDGINRAYAQSGNMRSNVAQAKVKVEGGVFTSQACVVGKIYIDCNGNHVQDAEELGIPGVRLYLEDGTYMDSDSEGKYGYCGLKPATHVLKVDRKTLPFGSLLKTTSSRNAGDADSIFVDSKSGEMTRADFAEGSCKPAVVEETKVRRTKGEVRSVDAPKSKGVRPGPKFESGAAKSVDGRPATANLNGPDGGAKN
jgi:uncharacterized repeat protein (TIGR01451 family)